MISIASNHRQPPWISWSEEATSLNEEEWRTADGVWVGTTICAAEMHPTYLDPGLPTHICISAAVVASQHLGCKAGNSPYRAFQILQADRSRKLSQSWYGRNSLAVSLHVLLDQKQIREVLPHEKKYHVIR